MPIYPFKCDNCGHKWEIFRKMSNSPGDKRQCVKCKKTAYRDYAEQRTQVTAWDPYVEENLLPGGRPVEIRSRAQRDALLEKHGVTYDRLPPEDQRHDPTPNFELSDDECHDIVERVKYGKVPEEEDNPLDLPEAPEVDED